MLQVLGPQRPMPNAPACLEEVGGEGTVLVLAAGTGNPYFTTDTCAALRATELNAEVLLKATKVDGVYDADPHTNPDAVRYESLRFADALDQQLGVMDLTALTMCMVIVVITMPSRPNRKMAVPRPSPRVLLRTLAACTGEKPLPTNWSGMLCLISLESIRKKCERKSPRQPIHCKPQPFRKVRLL